MRGNKPNKPANTPGQHLFLISSSTPNLIPIMDQDENKRRARVNDILAQQSLFEQHDRRLFDVKWVANNGDKANPPTLDGMGILILMDDASPSSPTDTEAATSSIS